MERQLDLFSLPAPAFANAPITRAVAGLAIRPDAARLRGQVLAFIHGRGRHGATDAEIQAALDMSCDTEQPRRRELTPAGRATVVWTAATIQPQEPAT